VEVSLEEASKEVVASVDRMLGGRLGGLPQASWERCVSIVAYNKASNQTVIAVVQLQGGQGRVKSSRVVPDVQPAMVRRAVQ
jgi:hypothetical protein